MPQRRHLAAHRGQLVQHVTPVFADRSPVLGRGRGRHSRGYRILYGQRLGRRLLLVVAAATGREHEPRAEHGYRDPQHPRRSDCSEFSGCSL